ncbi:MAG TPA: ATP-binding protein, partial [Gemmatimonadaceae bacterium]
MDVSAAPRIISFLPRLSAQDETAAFWLHQVTVRLRREICWRWHLRRSAAPPHDDALPPPESRLLEALDLMRYADAKEEFFRTDITARFLTQQLGEPHPASEDAARGSFGWVVRQLELSDAAAFTLALAVSATVDGAVGPVIAACLDDASRTSPTLALAQKLWDDPTAIIDLADPSQVLWTFSLVQPLASSAIAGSAIDWDTPFVAAPLVAKRLLFPNAPLPDAITPLDASENSDRDGDPIAEELRPAVARLRQTGGGGLRIVPVTVPARAMYRAVVARVAREAGRPVASADIDLSHVENPAHARALVTVAWLAGRDLLLRESMALKGADAHLPSAFFSGLRSLPVLMYVPVADSTALASLPAELVLPALVVPRLTFADRVAVWCGALGKDAKSIGPAIEECARRFRFERETILSIAAALRGERRKITAANLLAACRAEMPIHVGELAQEVAPRFRADELVLPPAQRLQFDEIHRAMRALTEVHFGWGTARAWNEAGVSVLFSGQPGTGKTMAAEVLAGALELPMFRIDLSQVVNKYIGETEKGLKRLFDLADTV